MSIAEERFKKLTGMVEDGVKAQEPPAPRTIEQEDQMALEDMILHLDGPDALARYQRRKVHSLKLNELPPNERAIIERERANQHDFPRPATGGMYAPRPASEDREPDIDSTGRCPDGRCRI